MLTVVLASGLFMSPSPAWGSLRLRGLPGSSESGGEPKRLCIRKGPLRQDNDLGLTVRADVLIFSTSPSRNV